jgi:hypothetical protein
MDHDVVDDEALWGLADDFASEKSKMLVCELLAQDEIASSQMAKFGFTSLRLCTFSD